MDASDLLTLRTALLITLSILLVALLWRRFKRNVVANDMPAPLHAELLALDVAYHPSRLIVVLQMPSEQTIGTSLLNSQHTLVDSWDERTFKQGRQVFEQPLPDLVDGAYFLELSTATQRTVRQFRLQQA